mmetsp:Transcript_18758/g.33313  ORF Transcript_18758/g.33313 Transcript_18758/m.33313 type:complete len:162 (+) Transcript_18758:1-486(+)
MVQLRVLHPIPAGSLQKIIIRAPEGIMYNEDSSSVRILPLPLPLRLAIPTQVAGDLLTLFLDETQDIVPALYNVRFEVSNPTVYPHDNTWSVYAQKDIVVEFSHVLTGYQEGMASPFDINVATALSNFAPRRWDPLGMGRALCVVSSILAALLALAADGRS